MKYTQTQLVITIAILDYFQDEYALLNENDLKLMLIKALKFGYVRHFILFYDHYSLYTVCKG